MVITKTNQKSKIIPKNMYGLFFEDINYGLDGGLHAEMLENRNFEFLKCCGKKYGYYQQPEYLYGWELYGENDGGSITIEDKTPLNEKNPHYLCANIVQRGCGFSNQAYDGIYVKKDGTYEVSFFAKRPDDQLEEIDVWICVLNHTGEIVTESAAIRIVSNQWTQYKTEIMAKEDVDRGLFAVIFDQSGKVQFDQFSMIPEDAILGLFRKDLAQLLKDLKPGFLRFPGGCVVEGNELSNRYQWKESIGSVTERKSNWNRWAVHGNDRLNREVSELPYYNQTLGIGYYEYFLLCEYLECEPLPIVNVGMACQYQSKEFVKSDSEEFLTYIQDTLDLIEFANGPEDSEWGSKRAEMGHPKSFHLKLLGIGNEQWETSEIDYFHRYDLFEKAIHNAYPEINCIGSAGPDVISEHYRDAWNFFSPRMKQKEAFAFAVDEHYYVSDQWLYEHVHMYDSYPRWNKVFAGEYACHIHEEEVPEKRNSFQAALAEAAFMTGLEKNCDVVRMAAYAPLLARLGYNQWQPDLIWFNGKAAYATPSYYVQQLYACFTGEEMIPVESDEQAGIYATASRTRENTLFIKVINVGNQEREVSIDFIEQGIRAKLWRLSGNPLDCNSITKRNEIIPKEMSVVIEDRMVIPAYSISLFCCKA